MRGTSAREVVGQVGNLLRVDNPPGGPVSTTREGRLTIGRRMPSCPTKLSIAAVILIATAAAAQEQERPEIQIQKVVAGLTFTEGPVWSRDGFLYFSDIPANRILQFVPGKGLVIFRENSNGANGNALDAQGRLYTCEGHLRRLTRTDRKGKVEVLAERYQGKRLNSPNDVVVRKDGNVYFTDPAFGSSDDKRELDFYGVYRVTLKGVLEVVAKPKGRPNGIALSPNGRILYVSNSDERNIRAYDLDHAGVASNERVLVSGIEGVPDGLRTDEKGNLYLAAKKIFIYSPEGKQLDEISLGDTPSNCAFGDPDFQSLYVTARGSVYRIRLEAKGSVQY
jgi:gluconolactonase